jgi:hypothetical protein
MEEDPARCGLVVLRSIRKQAQAATRKIFRSPADQLGNHPGIEPTLRVGPPQHLHLLQAAAEGEGANVTEPDPGISITIKDETLKHGCD